MKKLLKNKKGFSLVELILYISILVIFLGSMFLFITMVMESKAKNQTINEVERQGEFITRTIIRAIRGADSINSPTSGLSSNTTLSLSTTNPTKNPTTFVLSGTDLLMTEGLQTPITINNTLIDIANITFRNLTRPSTTGIIRVEVTIAHKNPANQNEFKYEKTFYGSATVRK